MSYNFSGNNKFKFYEKLGDSWRSLAVVLEISQHDQNQFEKGCEGLDILAWLETRQKLNNLPPALNTTGRSDLAVIFTSNQEPTDYNQHYLKLESALPKINFKELEKTINKLLTDVGHNCAALLLLQQSRTMGGDVCAKRIKELLAQETTELKHWPIGFAAHNRCDEQAILQGLSSHVGIAAPMEQSLEAYADSVIEKMMGSLQNGSIILIEFKKWQYLKPESQVFNWFMAFWQRVVDALNQASQHLRQVKIFVLIASDHFLSESCIKQEYQCTIEQFDSTKILEITLENWTHEEIKLWMDKYSGLGGAVIDEIAQNIYRTSQGMPQTITGMLLDECCPGATP